MAEKKKKILLIKLSSLGDVIFNIPLANALKDAGYEVFMEPTDKTIPSEIPYPIRVAFCYGPIGEEIEFFAER